MPPEILGFRRTIKKSDRNRPVIRKLQDFAKVEWLVEDPLGLCTYFGVTNLNEVAGTDHDTCVRRMMFDLVSKLGSGHSRHVVVEEGKIDRVLAEISQSFCTRFESLDAPTRCREQLDKDIALGGVIIHHDDAVWLGFTGSS
jgi:hypothetical protein